MASTSESQKFMGRGQLIDRLTSQVGSRELAIGLLRDRGQMEKHSEKLTAAGEKRNNMTAAERAKDRAATAAGLPTTAFKYNPKTNRATRR